MTRASLSALVLLLGVALSVAQPGWTVWNSNSYQNSPGRGQGWSHRGRYGGRQPQQTRNSAAANNRALDLYRLGWATGDVQIILSSVNNSTFSFTWVPTNDVVPPSRFPKFFADFMAEAEKKTNKEYFMTFDNIIHREVSYESAIPTTF